MLERPFVCTNMAITLDGKITSAYREHPRFTSPRDRQTMDMLRAEVDAVLVGAATLRADDPLMHVRDPRAQEIRKASGRQGPMLNVVVSQSLNLAKEARFFNNPHTRPLVVTSQAADPTVLRARGVEVWQVGQKTVDWPLLCQRLYRELGVRRLLVEGGGDIAWHFLKHDLLDEINVTIAPTLLGGAQAPTLIDGAGLVMSEQRRLKLVASEVIDGEIYCRYSVKRG